MNDNKKSTDLGKLAREYNRRCELEASVWLVERLQAENANLKTQLANRDLNIRNLTSLLDSIPPRHTDEEKPTEGDPMKTPGVTKLLKSLIEKNGRGVRPLAGLDGNSFVLIAHIRRRLSEEGWWAHDIDTIVDIAMSGSYLNLIWVLAYTLDETTQMLPSTRVWWTSWAMESIRTVPGQTVTPNDGHPDTFQASEHELSRCGVFHRD